MIVFGRHRSRCKMLTILLQICIIMCIYTNSEANNIGDIEPSNPSGGPVFIKYQHSPVEFLSDTGTSLDCVAHGTPDPKIEWFTLLNDGQLQDVVGIPSLRKIYSNGSMSLLSFSSEGYAQNVHATIYKCSASNIHGRIISPPISVRAITNTQLKQLQAQVYDEYVIKGNTAVLRCHIPTFFKDDLRISAWIREDNHVIKQHETGNPLYTVTETGNLHIRQPGLHPEMGYWCQVTNRITGDIYLSQKAGRVIVTQPQSAVSPTITDILEMVYARKGETVQLPCAAQGFPPPKYSWKKPDGTIVSDTHGLLDNPETQTTGSYEYKCIVSNGHGREERSTHLIVSGSLNIHMTQSNVNGGPDIKVSCTINGYPVKKIEWYFNSKPVLRNNRKVVKQNDSNISQLIILDPGSSDRGMYQCFASNDLEMVQSTLQLELGDFAPTLSETFEGRTLQPGPSVELKCSGISQPVGRIKWIRNGKVIGNDDRVKITQSVDDRGIVTSVIVVTNIRTEDGGEYICRMENSLGSKIHKDMINVYGLPYVHPMEDVRAADGDNVSINCYVSGYPIHSIKWLRGKKNERLAHDSISFPNGTLLLRHVKNKVDEGQYACQATSGQGQVSESSVHVNILVKPRLLSFNVPHDALEEGNPFSLLCSVVAGDRPIQISWTRNGHPIMMRHGIDMTTTKTYSVLQIHELKSEHMGNYTCFAENPVGKTGQSVRVIVRVPPSWMNEPSDMKAAAGTKIIIECSGIGFPKPSTNWYRITGGKLLTITNNPGIVTTNNSLIIPKSKQMDSGTYKCEVANGVTPNLEKQVFLSIGEIPKIKRLWSHSSSNETIYVTCVVDSAQPVNITWYKGDKPLDSSSNYRFRSSVKSELSTSRLQIRSSWLYTTYSTERFSCKAKNAFGESSSKINVRKNQENSLQSSSVAISSIQTSETPTPKATINIFTSSTSGVIDKNILGDESIMRTETTVSNIQEELSKTNSEFNDDSGFIGKEKAQTSTTNNRNFLNKISPTILFLVPAAVVIVLLICIIATVTVYLIRRRHNKSRRQQSADLKTDDEKHLMMKSQTNASLDRRYGRVQRSSVPSEYSGHGNRGTSICSNNYEIPDYYSGTKPYATLQLSSRVNGNHHHFQNRDSQASV